MFDSETLSNDLYNILKEKALNSKKINGGNKKLGDLNNIVRKMSKNNKIVRSMSTKHKNDKPFTIENDSKKHSKKQSRNSKKPKADIYENKKEVSKKKSKKSKQSRKQPNEAFEAWGKFRDHIAKKLNVKVSPTLMKFASMIKNEIKNKKPNLLPTDLFNESLELFDKNFSKYSDEYKKIIENKSKK